MNTIRNSLRMARKDLQLLFKDRGQLAILLALPLMLALIFGGSYATMRDPVTASGEPRLSLKAYLVNEDQGPHGAGGGRAPQHPAVARASLGDH